MAYNDFGAYVTRNGEHRPDREDCGVSTPPITPAYAEYGVLGDGPVYAVLGSPTDDWQPSIWKDGTRVTPGDTDEITVDGRHIEWREGHRCSRRWGHTVVARLTEPDGTVWEGECGSCFGAGFTNAPRFDNMPPVKLKEARWRHPVPCPYCNRRPRIIRNADWSSVQARVFCPRCGLTLYSDILPTYCCEQERHLLLRRTIANWNLLCSNSYIPQTGWYAGAGGEQVFVHDKKTSER